MAYLKGAKGSQLLIRLLISDPGVMPRVFAAPCSINAEREFALEVNVTESVGIDCANPDAPQWVERTADTLSATVTGGGRLHGPDYGLFYDWATSGVPRTCMVVTNVAAEDGGDIVEGEFMLTNLSKSGARGGDIEVSLTMQSSGLLERYEGEAPPEDSTPNGFAFTDVTGANLSTVYSSAPVTVSGINVPVAISVSGGLYSINGGAYTAASGQVENGDAVRARLTSSASNSTAASVTVTIGGVSDAFSVTTAAVGADTTPDPFAFVDVTNATVSTVYTSNAVTIAGINAATPVSITGGTYSKNGGAFVSGAGSVVAGDTLAVRASSSGSASSAVNVVLNLGGVTDTYTVTTAAPVSDTVPDVFTFTDVTGATQSTDYESNTITVAGINAAASMTITGGQYSKNGGAYAAGATTVVNGDTVKVKVTSSGSAATAANATLTISGVNDTFTVTTAADSAVYLPASPAPQFAIGMARLVNGYNGPAARIRRGGDDAPLTLAALPTSVDMSGYAAFAGAGATTVTEVDNVYDQAYILNGGAANANDFPSYDRPILRPRNAIGGHQTVTLGVNTGGSANYNKGFYNGTIVNHRDAVTMFWVGAIGGGATNSLGLWGLGNSGNYNSDTMSLLYDTTNGGSNLYHLSNNYQGFNGPPVAQLAVITVQGSPSRGIIRINGQVVRTDGPTSDVLMTGGFIGRGAWAGSILGSFDWVAAVGYAEALTDAEILARETVLATKFGITMQPFNRCISFEGDSITDGRNEGGYLINLLRLVQEDFADPRLMTRDFAGGAGSIEQMYAERDGTMQHALNLTFAKKAHHIWAGTNDIIARGGGNIVGYGATMWANFMLPYIQYAADPSRFGSNVIVGTMIPRGWLGSPTEKAQREAERQSYNQLIRDNASTYGYTVADYGGIAALVSGPNDGNPNYPDVTYYGTSSDVHLKENGYRLCADILTPIAQTMLA